MTEFTKSISIERTYDRDENSMILGERIADSENAYLERSVIIPDEEKVVREPTKPTLLEKLVKKDNEAMERYINERQKAQSLTMEQYMELHADNVKALQRIAAICKKLNIKVIDKMSRKKLNQIGLLMNEADQRAARDARACQRSAPAPPCRPCQRPAPAPVPQGRACQRPPPAPQGRSCQRPAPAPQAGRACPRPSPAPQGRACPRPAPAPQGRACPRPAPAPQGRACPRPAPAPQGGRACQRPAPAPQGRACPRPPPAPQRRACPRPPPAQQRRASPRPCPAPQPYEQEYIAGPNRGTGQTPFLLPKPVKRPGFVPRPTIPCPPQRVQRSPSATQQICPSQRCASLEIKQERLSSVSLLRPSDSQCRLQTSASHVSQPCRQQQPLQNTPCGIPMTAASTPYYTPRSNNQSSSLYSTSENTYESAQNDTFNIRRPAQTKGRTVKPKISNQTVCGRQT